jgi:hypothetical protein
MEPERSDLLNDLVARTVRVLEGRGLSVLPAAVRNVIEGLVTSAALQTGVSTDDALRLVEPEQVAALIAEADRSERHASVRPLREDQAHAEVAFAAAGQLINALSQVAKMAVANGDNESAVHAADLLSEFGAGIAGSAVAVGAAMARGALSETAQILDRVAKAFEGAGWSACPCGEDHGQADLDRGLPKAFRANAEMTRQILLTDLAKGN